MKKTIAVFTLATVLMSSSVTFAQTKELIKETQAIKTPIISRHWAQASLEKLADKGVIALKEDNYKPDENITRSEFAAMLHKALGIQIAYFKAPDIKDYFADVEQDAPYASAIIDLVTANILEGKGSFNPENSLTREEVIYYIMNAFRYKMGEDYKLMKLSSLTFADDNDIDPSYSGAVARAAYHKLVVGKGQNLFQPKDKTTRAEAAAVITNLLNLLETENQEIVIKPSVVLKEKSLEMKLSIINNSEKTVTFSHSSGQKYDFVLLDSEKNELYRWSDGRFFTLMLTSSTILAGETLEYEEFLEEEIYREIKDKAIYLKAYLVGSSDSFTVNPKGYELLLKPGLSR